MQAAGSPQGARSAIARFLRNAGLFCEFAKMPDYAMARRGRAIAGYDSEDSMADKIEILLVGPPKPTIVNGLAPFTVHRLGDGVDQNALLTTIGPRIRAIASSVTSERIDGGLMGRLPHLEIVATFGVGYDHIDVP